MAALRRTVSLLVLAATPAIAPNTYHPTEAVWGHTKRCDMLDRASTYDSTRGKNGHPGFTSLTGGWQYPYPSRVLTAC